MVLDQPIGEMVNVNRRAVHVHCMGEGIPTIWLENGWASVSLNWLPFQEVLAQHTRVCAYDRAGYGWSEPNGINRSAQKEADEFSELLDVLGQDEPFILVAWSGGGPVAQIVAADHPDKVTGLVLIDAIPPGYDLWAAQAFPNQFWQERQEQLEIVRQYAEKAASHELKYEDIAGWFVQPTLDLYGERYTKLLLENPHSWWTYYWENQFVMISSAQVKAKVSVSDLPMKVMIASHLPEDQSIYQQSLGRMWQTMQQAQAALSTHSEVIWVDAGHAIFRYNPQAVIDAVLDLMDTT